MLNISTKHLKTSQKVQRYGFQFIFFVMNCFSRLVPNELKQLISINDKNSGDPHVMRETDSQERSSPILTNFKFTSINLLDVPFYGVCPEIMPPRVPRMSLVCTRTASRPTRFRNARYVEKDDMQKQGRRAPNATQRNAQNARNAQMRTVTMGLLVFFYPLGLR